MRGRRSKAVVDRLPDDQRQQLRADWHVVESTAQKFRTCGKHEISGSSRLNERISFESQNGASISWPTALRNTRWNRAIERLARSGQRHDSAGVSPNLIGDTAFDTTGPQQSLPALRP